MSWAGNRRLGIILVILLVIAVVIAGVLALIIPQKPTCSDGIMNQDEAGVDCGGSCAYLCVADVIPPSVSFARVVPSGDRLDVVALIKNNDTRADVHDAEVAVELFDAKGVLIADHLITIDLPAGEEIPLFVPGLAAASAPVARAFISFNEETLLFTKTRGLRTLPRADAIQISSEGTQPRVTANIFNPTPRPLRDVEVIAIVRDSSDVVIAASKTVIEQIPAQASEPVIFTWPAPFTASVGRIEVRAALPLP